MKRDFEADRTYSSIDNPTAAYPRDKMSAYFDSEDSEPATASDLPPAPAASVEVPREEGVSLVYLGLALVGGGLLAVGVSGLLALLLLAS